jgi:hypothetical protein
VVRESDLAILATWPSIYIVNLYGRYFWLAGPCTRFSEERGGLWPDRFHEPPPVVTSGRYEQVQPHAKLPFQPSPYLTIFSCVFLVNRRLRHDFLIKL